MAEIILLDAATNGHTCSYCGFPVYVEGVPKNSGGNLHRTHYHVSCALVLGLVSRDQVLAWYADGHAKLDGFAADDYFGRLTGGWPS